MSKILQRSLIVSKNIARVSLITELVTELHIYTPEPISPLILLSRNILY